MIEKTVEIREVEARKVKSMIWGALSEMFKDYLSENIGDDILACYDGERWELDIVVADIDEAVRSWANELEGLKEFVEECVEPFTDDDDLEGW